MSDSASTASKNASSLTRPRAFEAILYGGLVVGVLDGLDAVIFFGLGNGVKPIRVFQSIG